MTNHQTLPQELTPELMEQLLIERRQTLELLHPFISKKLAYRIEEKLEQEKAMCKKILDIQDASNAQQSNYSFILDNHYFEQKFIQ